MKVDVKKAYLQRVKFWVVMIMQVQINWPNITAEWADLFCTMVVLYSNSAQTHTILNEDFYSGPESLQKNTSN